MNSSAHPTVSVIIPIYNGAHFLDEALDSVLAQDYAGVVDILVVDDGSTDSGPAIVTARNITLLRQENAGAGAARNTGVAASRGELVAFLDQDDVWFPSKLRQQVELLVAHPDSICLAQQAYFLESGAPVPPWFLRPELLASDHAGWAPSCLITSRTTLERVGRFDEQLRHGSDVDWFSRASRMGVPVHMPEETLVRRRLHRMNDSQNLAAKKELFLICSKAAARRRATAADSA